MVAKIEAKILQRLAEANARLKEAGVGLSLQHEAGKQVSTEQARCLRYGLFGLEDTERARTRSQSIQASVSVNVPADRTIQNKAQTLHPQNLGFNIETKLADITDNLRCERNYPP